MAKRKKKSTRSPQPAVPSGAQFAVRPLQGPLAELKRQLAQPSPKQAPQVESAPARRPAPAREGRAGAPLSESDEDALSMAMVGVQPLASAGPQRVSRAGAIDSRTHDVAQHADRAEGRARARLDALVAEGVSFRVEWQDEHVSGLRTGADPHIVRRLRGRRAADDVLDLHGWRAAEAEREVARFVREAYRRGLELVCVVHGKGLHSDDGRGVLREVCVTALTESGAAPCVVAFCAAPAALGGTGALLVQLSRR